MAADSSEYRRQPHPGSLWSRTISMSAGRKAAIVTGAAGGIGSATANLFVKNGWEVISIDRLDMPSSNGRSVRADLSDAHELNRCVSEISTAFNKIDAL